MLKRKNPSIQIPNINLSDNQTPAIMIGGGGHAQSLFDLATQSGIMVKGYVNPLESEFFTQKQIHYLGSDLKFLTLNQKDSQLLLGIGFAKQSQNRSTIRKLYESHEMTFKNIYGLNSSISASASLSDCVYIHQHCHIGSGVTLSEGVVINTGAIVEHGVFVGRDSHIAPGAVVCGAVKIGNNTQIGANSTILPGLCVGDNAIIGAGAVVTKSIPSNTCVVGNPHRFI